MVCTLICKTEDVCEDDDNEIQNPTEQMAFFWICEEQKKRVVCLSLCECMRVVSKDAKSLSMTKRIPFTTQKAYQ